MSFNLEHISLERDFYVAPVDIGESVSDYARALHQAPENNPPLSPVERLLAKEIVRHMVPPTRANASPTWSNSPEMVVTRGAVNYVKKLAMIVGCQEDKTPKDIFPPHRSKPADMRNFVEQTVLRLPDLTKLPSLGHQVQADLGFIVLEPQYTGLADAAVAVSVMAFESTRLDNQVFGKDLLAWDERMAGLEPIESPEPLQ